MVQTSSSMTNLTATLRQTARTFAITILLASSLFGFSAGAAEPEVQAATQAITQPAAAGKQAPGEQADYAAREQQDQKLADFQGGDTVVVVGGTTLVIVLLVILIVVIL
jgi:hypothetical protein